MNKVDFENMIRKAVEQIYYENIRLYKLRNNVDWLEYGWDSLNGILHLTIVYRTELENFEHGTKLLNMVKSYQDQLRDRIKDHHDSILN